MRSGDLDRPITLQRNTENATDAIGGKVEVWTTLRKVWAKFLPLTGREIIMSGRVGTTESGRFYIYYFDGLTTKDRIQFKNKNWDILNIREIGRREGLELLAEVIE